MPCCLSVITKWNDTTNPFYKMCETSCVFLFLQVQHLQKVLENQQKQISVQQPKAKMPATPVERARSAIDMCEKKTITT